VNEILTSAGGLTASNPVIEVLAGTIGLVVIIIIHGFGIRIANRRFSQAWVNVNAYTPFWRVNLILATAIATLSVLHFLETLLWAVPIQATGLIPQMRDSYFFVLESYTTLGEGPVDLPEQWRLIGPIIAMSGLFTFGWTGSVLVSIMTEFGRLDRSRARSEKSEKDAAGGDPLGPRP
jgi:hypothetical protein